MMDENASTESAVALWPGFRCVPIATATWRASQDAAAHRFLACGGVDGSNNLLRPQLGRKTFA